MARFRIFRHFIFNLAVISAALTVAAEPECLWRFDHCSRRTFDLKCMVLLRQWCPCSESTSQQCNCENESATQCPSNTTIEVNMTKAMTILEKNSEGRLRKFCRPHSCTVVREQCEWSPWEELTSHSLVRRRKFCCHPVTKKEMNVFFCHPEKEYRFCKNPGCGSVTRNLSQLEVNNDEFTPPNFAIDNNSPVLTPWQIALSIAAPFILVFIVICIGSRCRKQRPPTAVVYQKMPDDIVRLQPGDPIPPERLPIHLRTPAPIVTSRSDPPT